MQRARFFRNKRVGGYCRQYIGFIAALLLIGGGGPARAQDQPAPGELTELSLEQLMNIDVTSVSKKEERLFDAPAAIYVLTNEDIRRSGATTIPEALRMVPGLEVAQIDANKWAITARGFNTLFANKLLVLIDGRSVYTPFFSGVYWDVQDVMLEDIDRIEVIRGPGATLWGANAVNGVINITTKSAKETQGVLATTGFGSHEQGFGAARYGGKIGDTLHYRVYAKYFNRENFVDLQGRDAPDDWDMIRGGFRFDWALAERDNVTLQGDLYDGDVGGTENALSFTPPFSRVRRVDEDTLGGNVIGRWTHTLSERSSTSLQLYYDRTEREFTFRERRDTYDVDFQHDIAFGERHAVVWGLGYRLTSDDLRPLTGTLGSLDPSSRNDQLFSLFAQDQIRLIPERLALTLGSKFEHNDYSGFEVQPSIRLVWTPSQRHTVWGAVSRAVRTPSRVEENFRLTTAVIPLPDGLPSSIDLFGNRDLKAEELMAYELGYRMQPLDRLSVDIAAFYNVYDDLSSIEPGVPAFTFTPVPHLSIPLIFKNKAHGETYGVEVASTLVATEWWRLMAGYTWLEMQLHKTPGSLASGVTDPERQSPHNQFNFRSFIDLPWRLQFDTMLYYVDNLPAFGTSSYFRLDLRLGWQPTEQLDFSLVGQNLNNRRHDEFGQVLGSGAPSEIERSVYGKITWKF